MTKRKENPSKRGRPSKYKQEYIEQARKLTLLGLTIPKLAKFFGVGETTIDRWMVDHPDFRAAIVGAREPADAEVADAMHRNACGFEWEEEQAFKVKVGPNEERIEVVKVKRRVPPNFMAGMFLMTNRHPDLWRRAPDPEGGADLPTPVKIVVEVKDAGIPEPA